MADPQALMLNTYKRLSSLPGGGRLFGVRLGRVARYSATLHPEFADLQPGRSEIHIKKRKALTNHIGTMHAAAIANLCELTGASASAVSVPNDRRWIPNGLEIRYLA